MVSTAGSGGLAYLETLKNVEIEVGIKSDVQSCKSGLQGGVFFLGGALDNTLTLKSEASFQNLDSQEGSIAVFTGINNFLASDFKLTIIGC